MTIGAIVATIIGLISAIGIISAAYILYATCSYSKKCKTLQEQEQIILEELLRDYILAKAATEPSNVVADVTDSFKIIE